MPEKIVWSTAPLADAINKVTSNGQFQWRFRKFTSNDKQYWKGQPVKTGVKIEVYHPRRGWENITIRDDYDFQNGEAPSGKGYHVNVEAPSEKIAFCESSRVDGEKYVGNMWDYISERVSVDGDQQAAKWYMRAKKTL